MKNSLQDYKSLQKWSSQMGGVFSTSDLSNLFNEGNPVMLNRRIKRLEESAVLSRFIRGYYITENFDAQILSARINTASYISLGTVLAKKLIIGSVPAKTLYAVKTGRNKLYRNTSINLEYLGITRDLFFGYENTNGVNIATPEKAFLDTLYFYQLGQQFSFNIYEDISLESLNKETIINYLKRYKNPNFKVFVKGYLENE
jgi:predicted transcriptional regulator of viral defense system